MNDIKLGDKVKCKVTGFVGTVSARTEFLNGCVQYEIIPKVSKDNKILDGVSIDEQNLEVIMTKKNKSKKKENGGPMRKVVSFRGY